MMTADEMIAVIQAHKEGRNIECKMVGSLYSTWGSSESPWWDFKQFDYRIKPSLRLRAWKPEEVPVGAVVRLRKKPDEVDVILGVVISGMFPRAILSGKLTPYLSHYLTDMLTYHGGNNGDAYEHSTDQGKTWQPCGIQEEV